MDDAARKAMDEQMKEAIIADPHKPITHVMKARELSGGTWGLKEGVDYIKLLYRELGLGLSTKQERL